MRNPKPGQDLGFRFIRPANPGVETVKNHGIKDYAQTAGKADMDPVQLAKRLANYQIYLANVRITCQTGLQLDNLALPIRTNQSDCRYEKERGKAHLLQYGRQAASLAEYGTRGNRSILR